MSFFQSIKDFFSSVGDEISKIPSGVSVVVGGVEHVVRDDVYGGAKTIVSDVYTGGKTMLQDGIGLTGQALHVATTAEQESIQPFTSTFQSFSYPLMIIAGGLGFYIIYEMSQTSRAALPYMPSIIESGARVAPLFA